MLYCFLFCPTPFWMIFLSHLFYNYKNFEWTLITFRQVFVCDWAYCALLNSEECDIFLIFLGWIQTHHAGIEDQSIIHQLHSFIGSLIYSFILYVLWFFSSFIHSFTLSSFGKLYFSSWVVYWLVCLFCQICRVVQSPYSSLSQIAFHCLPLTPRYLQASAYILSLAWNLSLPLMSQYFLFVSVQYITKKILRAQLGMAGGCGGRDRRFIFPNCFWAPPWNIQSVCHSFIF